MALSGPSIRAAIDLRKSVQKASCRTRIAGFVSCFEVEPQDPIIPASECRLAEF